MNQPTRAGVRELRQNASKLLDRVAAGESIEITNHGRAVARLVPIDLVYPRAFEVLLAEGLIHPGAGSPWAVEPREAPPGTRPSEVLLREQRADR